MIQFLFLNENKIILQGNNLTKKLTCIVGWQYFTRSVILTYTGYTYCSSTPHYMSCWCTGRPQVTSVFQTSLIHFPATFLTKLIIFFQLHCKLFQCVFLHSTVFKLRNAYRFHYSYITISTIYLVKHALFEATDWILIKALF